MCFNNEKDMRICPCCNREVERGEMDFRSVRACCRGSTHLCRLNVSDTV